MRNAVPHDAGLVPPLPETSQPRRTAGHRGLPPSCPTSPHRVIRIRICPDGKSASTVLSRADMTHAQDSGRSRMRSIR